MAGSLLKDSPKQGPSKLTDMAGSPGAPPTAASVAVVSLSGPKRKRPSWVLAGVVLVVFAALAGAWVFTSTSKTMSVMVADHDLTAGEVVGTADLRAVEMGRTAGLRAVQPSQQALIVGRAARGPIPAGTVLNIGLFADKDEVIPTGQVVVGAALDQGAAPTSRLSAGDRVELLAVAKTTGAPPASDGSDPVATVLTTGTVWSVEKNASTSSSSKLWLSVLIPAGSQPAVVQAAADGRLRLSLVGVSG